MCQEQVLLTVEHIFKQFHSVIALDGGQLSLD